MRTVELLGDEELDRAVRAAWRRLDQAGFPSLARHRHPTNRPHLTLASAEQWPSAAAAAIAGALRGLPVVVREVHYLAPGKGRSWQNATSIKKPFPSRASRLEA